MQKIKLTAILLSTLIVAGTLLITDSSRWADAATATTVKSVQKISSTEGNFGGVLNDGDHFGQSIANIGDLDGDGITDLAVGAGGEEGVVWILFMNSDGTVKSEQKISETEGNFGGVITSRSFGSSVAGIGDLNGDDIPDLAVGATHGGDDGGDSGAVWILFMNTDGTVQSEWKISNTEGGFDGVLLSQDFFGRASAGIGDLNGDGLPDLAVGAEAKPYGVQHGAVWVLSLFPETVWREQKINATEGGFGGVLGSEACFGCSLAGIGDFDGDGIPDIAVGALGTDDTVWILFMNTDGTVKSYRGMHSGPGNSLANIGDLNGDGIIDLAVGDASYDGSGINRGALSILLPDAIGSLNARFRISENIPGFGGVLDDDDRFGRSVAGIGDLNGDDIPDLAVGAIGDDDGGLNRGAVWILFMGPPEGYLYVASALTHNVKRYDGNTGAFVDDFTITPFADFGTDLGHPYNLAIGPNGNLYVNWGPVLRYDGTTGDFIDLFVDDGGDLDFGPDANLYVTDQNGVKRYEGDTGSFIDTFVSVDISGLNESYVSTFGPDGELYVADSSNQILRYDGETGAFIDTFVSSGSGGLDRAHDLDFGPDGNLYVVSGFTQEVIRYDGQTGEVMDVITTAEGGGNPSGLDFGPDGNLYLSDLNNRVDRYDGTTGAFIDMFVSSGSGGLEVATDLVFTPPPLEKLAMCLEPTKWKIEDVITEPTFETRTAAFEAVLNSIVCAADKHMFAVRQIEIVSKPFCLLGEGLPEDISRRVFTICPPPPACPPEIPNCPVLHEFTRAKVNDSVLKVLETWAEGKLSDEQIRDALESMVEKGEIQINTNYVEGYTASLSNGEVIGTDIDPESTSLLLFVETSATEDGTMEITLPKEILDAEVDDGLDGKFIVMADGEKTDFEETSVTLTERTLNVRVPAGTEEIEIMGTQVIPEFGMLAVLVLVGAMGAIIVVSRRDLILKLFTG